MDATCVRELKRTGIEENESWNNQEKQSVLNVDL